MGDNACGGVPSNAASIMRSITPHNDDGHDNVASTIPGKPCRHGVRRRVNTMDRREVLCRRLGHSKG